MNQDTRPRASYGYLTSNNFKCKSQVQTQTSDT